MTAPEPTGYDTRPDYRVDLLRRRNRVRVVAGDRVLADTTSPLLVDEQDHGIVVYVPAADVDLGALAPTDDRTRCPYKGWASYWRLAEPGDVGDGPVAWTYREPYPQVAGIAGHIAFFQDRVRVEIGTADPAVSR